MKFREVDLYMGYESHYDRSIVISGVYLEMFHNMMAALDFRDKSSD